MKELLLIYSCNCSQVKLNFLVVGHTHENVDQLFSRVNTHLKADDTMTPKDLYNVLKRSYPKMLKVGYVQSVDDYKATFLNDGLGGAPISNHKHPLQFKIQRNDPSSTRLTDIHV